MGALDALGENGLRLGEARAVQIDPLLGLGLLPRLAGALDRDPAWCVGGAIALAVGGLATSFSARVIAPGRAPGG